MISISFAPLLSAQKSLAPVGRERGIVTVIAFPSGKFFAKPPIGFAIFDYVFFIFL
jgi:hypothetical protein